jgi:hypothetical protein
MTAGDVLLLIPWLVFGAAIAVIAYRLLSRRGTTRHHRRGSR